MDRELVKHIAACPSQYDETCRELAAEVLRLDADLAHGIARCRAQVNERLVMLSRIENLMGHLEEWHEPEDLHDSIADLLERLSDAAIEQRENSKHAQDACETNHEAWQKELSAKNEAIETRDALAAVITTIALNLGLDAMCLIEDPSSVLTSPKIRTSALMLATLKSIANLCNRYPDEQPGKTEIMVLGRDAMIAALAADDAFSPPPTSDQPHP